MQHALVIAYGNPLRGDDGLAWRVAEELRRTLSGLIGPELARILCVHQLAPELAEEASDAELVIFLDAAAEGDAGEVLCRPVEAQPEPACFWHHIAPAQILALCEQLYTAKPRGFLLTVSGERFEHGDTLSSAAIGAIPRAVAVLCALIERRVYAA
jgi:hydrogenase maturation protease